MYLILSSEIHKFKVISNLVPMNEGPPQTKNKSCVHLLGFIWSTRRACVILYYGIQKCKASSDDALRCHSFS